MSFKIKRKQLVGLLQVECKNRDLAQPRDFFQNIATHFENILITLREWSTNGSPWERIISQLFQWKRAFSCLCRSRTVSRAHAGIDLIFSPSFSFSHVWREPLHKSLRQKNTFTQFTTTPPSFDRRPSRGNLNLYLIVPQSRIPPAFSFCSILLPFFLLSLTFMHISPFTPGAFFEDAS